jgi:hypothetical protein
MREGYRHQATGFSKKDLKPETCSLMPSLAQWVILVENRHKGRPDTP